MKTDFKIAKIRIFVLSVMIFSVIAFTVFAIPSTVRVLNFHYENLNGKETVTVTNSGTVLGYYPDYNFQPDSGYILQILDNNNNAIFSVKMLPPSESYAHEYEGKNITGGLVILNQTDFSMTLPTFQNESKIIILNNDNKDIMNYRIPVQNSKTVSKAPVPFALIFAFALILLVFVLAVRLKRKKS